MDNSFYIIFLIVLVFAQFRLRRIIWHKKIIGRQVFITYHDKAPTLKEQFPLEGTITKTVQLITTKHFVVELDKPFSYKKKSYSFILIKDSNMLQTIGKTPLTDIKVIIPKINLDNDKYNDMTKFETVALARIEFP